MPNRLQHAESLYLRQHGSDPVDWHPWGEPALALAREHGRLILLSIGYSACHWCHVMAKESFADPDIAALMNRDFVNIKVDREEHPELDRVYQLAHQALNQRPGGWPLTVFLDPHSLLPLFVGTYFPPQPRHGMPGFGAVLEGVARWAREQPLQVNAQAVALQDFLDRHLVHPAEQGALDPAPLALAEQRWLEQADPLHGGHRGAPKFPPLGELAWCLRRDDADLRRHAIRTLRAMALGGLQDQLGGGFFRYSVDEHWGIPHYEKMLSDNAQLLPLYAQLAASGDDEARAAAIGIVRWLQEEMQLGGGGFASALDADSEGGEGTYYLWSAEQWLQAVAQAERPLLARYFGVDQPPNAGGGRWHLRIALGQPALAAERDIEPQRLHEQIKAACRRLRLARAQRPPPARDDKFLCGWNGLLLSGLARAARAMGREDWQLLAQHLADALRQTLHVDGRLHALAYAGRAAHAASLDDHAALLCGLLDLLALRWRRADLDFAVEIADALLAHFEDREQGGFWFSAHDQPRLPQRAKPWLDEATPSGNGLAAQGLQRLGALLSEPRYLLAAERCLRAGWAILREHPEACASLLPALQAQLHPPPLLVARLGDAHEHQRWREALEQMRDEGAEVVLIPAEESMLPDALEDKRWLRGGRVYWCEGMRCLPRFDSPVGLLGSRGARRPG